MSSDLDDARHWIRSQNLLIEALTPNPNLYRKAEQLRDRAGMYLTAVRQRTVDRIRGIDATEAENLERAAARWLIEALAEASETNPPVADGEER